MRAFRALLTVLIPTLIVVGGLEVALRLVPALVPLKLLQHFHDDLRLAVAVKLDLPNRTDVTAVERDDGGPFLRKYLPHQSVTQDFLDEGATTTITTDDLGFCNPPSASYERESFDIIAIGDSLTWCTAVEPDETWPAFLGELSGQSIYNLGFPGVGLYEYLVFLRKFGLPKRPKVVVMNFTEGNDLRDALRYWRHRRHGGRGAPGSAEEERSPPLWNVLGSFSYTYNLVVAGYREWLQPNTIDAAADGTVEDARLAFIDKKDLDFEYVLDFGERRIQFNLRNADRDELKHSIVVAEGLIPLDVFDDAFTELMRLSREHDFVPLVTYSPSAHVAYADYAVHDQKWVGPIARTYSETLRELIAERAEVFGFEYLDLTDLLKREIESQGARRADLLLYYPGSLHYSIEGNRVVGREIAAHLASIAP